MIYFIEAATEPRSIKIGYTRAVGSRVATIRSASPVAVIPLGEMPGERADEFNLHARFAAARLRGEWFAATEALVEFIKHNATPPTQRRTVGDVSFSLRLSHSSVQALEKEAAKRGCAFTAVVRTILERHFRRLARRSAA